MSNISCCVQHLLHQVELDYNLGNQLISNLMAYSTLSFPLYPFHTAKLILPFLQNHEISNVWGVQVSIGHSVRNIFLMTCQIWDEYCKCIVVLTFVALHETWPTHPTCEVSSSSEPLPKYLTQSQRVITPWHHVEEAHFRSCKSIILPVITTVEDKIGADWPVNWQLNVYLSTALDHYSQSFAILFHHL